MVGLIQRLHVCTLTPDTFDGYPQQIGQRILDACGGAAVCSVGHAHPRIVAALSNQLGKLSYIHSGAFANEVRARTRILVVTIFVC